MCTGCIAITAIQLSDNSDTTIETGRTQRRLDRNRKGWKPLRQNMRQQRLHEVRAIRGEHHRNRR